MWKKEGAPEPAPAARPEPALSAERTPPPAPPRPVSTPERVATPTAMTGQRDRAMIGQSITIKGEVSGNEDLLIQGRVEGSVNLKQNYVTIGPDGDVKADITGRVVMVEGSVEGNLSAEEQVILRSSAMVQGDIVAPRVVLEDGARFRGGVDMGASLDRGRKETARAAPVTMQETSRTSTRSDESPAQIEIASSDEPKTATTGKRDSMSRTPAQV
jgi:cytoskeletal protein CcmA (bactofilin family)